MNWNDASGQGPSGDIQSWVFNRLPLSSQQKWDLLEQLRQESHKQKQEPVNEQETETSSECKKNNPPEPDE